MALCNLNPTRYLSAASFGILNTYRCLPTRGNVGLVRSQTSRQLGSLGLTELVTLAFVSGLCSTEHLRGRDGTHCNLSGQCLRPAEHSKGLELTAAIAELRGKRSGDKTGHITRGSC